MIVNENELVTETQYYLHRFLWILGMPRYQTNCFSWMQKFQLSICNTLDSIEVFEPVSDDIQPGDMKTRW